MKRHLPVLGALLFVGCNLTDKPDFPFSGDSDNQATGDDVGLDGGGETAAPPTISDDSNDAGSGCDQYTVLGGAGGEISLDNLGGAGTREYVIQNGVVVDCNIVVK